MRGKVIAYSDTEGQGLISGDDGRRSERRRRLAAHPSRAAADAGAGVLGRVLEGKRTIPRHFEGEAVADRAIKPSRSIWRSGVE